MKLSVFSIIKQARLVLLSSSCLNEFSELEIKKNKKFGNGVLG